MKTQMSFPKVTFRFTLVVLTLLLAACAQNYRVNVDAINSADIAFLSSQENLIFASGQPTQEQVGVLADAGIRPTKTLDFSRFSATVQEPNSENANLNLLCALRTPKPLNPSLI